MVPCYRILSSMSERWLSDLPGYQPEGFVDSLDAYFMEKRGKVNDPLGYLSNTALEGGGLVIGPEQVEGIVTRGRERMIRRQGASPYVSELAGRLIVASRRDVISTRPTETTALTTLFRDEYGIDLTPYMEQSTNMLGITGMPDRGGASIMDLDYMAIRSTRGNTFWQLRGQGNIANIPGVAEALTADTAFIEANPRRSPGA